MTTAAWIDHWAAHRPQHPAVVFDGRSITYQDFQSAIDGTTHYLTEHGVGTGDRIVWLGPNHPTLLTLLFAASRLGAALVPLNDRLTVTEHRFRIDDCTPTIAFVDPGLNDHFREVLAGAEAKPELIALDLASIGLTPNEGNQETGQTTPPLASTDSPALIVYRNDDNGTGRGVVHTQDSLLHTVLNGVAAHDMRSDDIGLAFEPMCRIGGLTVQTLPLLYVGGTVELHRSFDPGAVLIALEEKCATTALFVPATMKAIIEHEDYLFTRFATLRGVMTTSSTVPMDLLEAFRERGIRPGQVYGSIETGPTAIVLRFDDSDVLGTVGRAALHTAIRLSPDGEILVRGRNVFANYWNNPDATAAAFTDGWYRTGDRGRVDENGWMFVDSRLDRSAPGGVAQDGSAQA